MESLGNQIARIDERVKEIHRAVLGSESEPGLRRDVRDLQEFRAAARGAYWLAGIVFAGAHVGLMLYIHFSRN